MNPVLNFSESILTEEEQPVAMVTGGEDEEGAISDPGSEVLDESSDKFKVQLLQCQVSMIVVIVCDVSRMTSLA